MGWLSRRDMKNNKYFQNIGAATLLKQQPLRKTKICEVDAEGIRTAQQTWKVR